MSASCRSCGAAIVWAVTKNGKSMPVDAEPAREGNLVLVPDADPREPPLVRAPTVADHDQFVRHLSHFATCPNAATHRKGGRS